MRNSQEFIRQKGIPAHPWAQIQLLFNKQKVTWEILAHPIFSNFANCFLLYDLDLRTFEHL